MRTIGVIPAACACATISTTVSRSYAECSVQIITKSIPAAASVCTTPRPRASHSNVPNATPPDLSVALSRLTRMAFPPLLTIQVAYLTREVEVLFHLLSHLFHAGAVLVKAAVVVAVLSALELA